MKYENLFNLLNIQTQNLGELLTIVKLQQEALINNNRDLLDESVKQEEELFNEVNRLQKLIIVEIKNVDEREKFGIKEYKLQNLIKALTTYNSPDVKMLLTYRNQLVKYVKEISRLNFQNSFLIDHSRELIKEIITAAAKNKNLILDRRF